MDNFLFDEIIDEHSLTPTSFYNLLSPIKFLSAPCGSGKTHVICQAIKNDWQKHKHIMFVLPTLVLISEVSKKLQDLGVNHEVITNENAKSNVRKMIMGRLANPTTSRTVLLVTYAAFIGIPYFRRREDWQIIIDEIPSPDTFFSFKLPDNPEHITDHLTVKKCQFPDLYQVVPVKRNDLKKLLERSYDNVRDTFEDLYRHVLGDHHEVYVPRDKWDAFVTGGSTVPGEIHFISMVSHHALHGALILGANFSNSMLFQWITRRYGNKFQEESDLLMGLRYQQHDLNDRARIHYLVDRKSFSKSLKSKVDEDGRSLIDRMDQEAIKFFGDKKFLYMENNGSPSKVLEQCEMATKIPVKSHGLNVFSDHVRIYISAALNVTPTHRNMLLSFGFTSQQLKISTAHEAYYQAIMRTSLRNLDATDVVDILVPDAGSADTIARLLGVNETSIVASINDDMVSLTSNQKKSRYRSRLIIKSHFLDCLPILIDVKRNGGQSGKSDQEQFLLTLHDEPKVYESNQLQYASFSLQEFVRFMKTQSRNVVATKESPQLINPSLFEHHRSNDSVKSNATFVCSCCLFLDFDKGQFSPQDFIVRFGRTAPTHDRLTFMITNSFSRSKEEPNRFRVILPFKTNTRTVEDHHRAYDYMKYRLLGFGWDIEELGLDKNSRNPTQSFYLPCIAIQRPDMAFFEAHNTKASEFELYGLDQEKIQVFTQGIEEPEIPWIGECLIPQELIDQIISRHPLQAGQNDQIMWSIANDLDAARYQGCRMPMKQLSDTLLGIAGRDRKLINHAKSKIRSKELDRKIRRH